MGKLHQENLSTGAKLSIDRTVNDGRSTGMAKRRHGMSSDSRSVIEEGTVFIPLFNANKHMLECRTAKHSPQTLHSMRPRAHRGLLPTLPTASKGLPTETVEMSPCEHHPSHSSP